MRSSKTRALQRRLEPWARAAALGAVVGSRSLLVPALLARKAGRPVLPLLAAMEIAADKIPSMPARTSAPSLAARVLIGAAVAFRVASRAFPWRTHRTLKVALGCALVGGSFAAASAFVLQALRSRPRAGILGAAVEDVIALGAGMALTHPSASP